MWTLLGEWFHGNNNVYAALSGFSHMSHTSKKIFNIQIGISKNMKCLLNKFC